MEGMCGESKIARCWSFDVIMWVDQQQRALLASPRSPQCLAEFPAMPGRGARSAQHGYSEAGSTKSSRVGGGLGAETIVMYRVGSEIREIPPPLLQSSTVPPDDANQGWGSSAPFLWGEMLNKGGYLLVAKGYYREGRGSTITGVVC
eukprot:764949-Hanusia_phi.AAC.5